MPTDQKPDSDLPDAPSRGGIGGLLPWAGLALMFYVLSIGPASRLVIAGYLPRNVATLYKPVILLAIHSPPAARFFNWYVLDVWRLRSRLPAQIGPPPRPVPLTNTPTQ